MGSKKDLEQFSHKVHLDKFSGFPAATGPSFQEWFDNLPFILTGNDVRDIVGKWVEARRSGKKVIWGFGAHLIKAGLSRWIISLMQEGLITHLAVNGAVTIHDFELAAVGHTSEDVHQALSEGVFGTAEETALFINRAAKVGLRRKIGLGEALSTALLKSKLPHRDISVLAAAARLGVSVTVHLALGTDTIHTHPSADGKALGETSLKDFHRFCTVVDHLDGGLFFNIGSAVVLPEVFLKAVSRARSKGGRPLSITTVVMDFIRQYRPLENVMRRPVGKKGQGFYLIGHHEIMVPLLGQAVLNAWRSKQ